MTYPRYFAAALAVPLALLVGLGPVLSGTAGAAEGASASAGPGPQLPQLPAARSAAQWLSSQFDAQGFIPVVSGSSKPDLSATAQSVLSLAAVATDVPAAQEGLAYLEDNIDSYVTADGADGPGQLALLILDAEALGADPQSFGGTDLVSRLLATEQTSGADAGLFGTEAQLATYQAGTFDQGLALAALAGAGVRETAPVASAESWLLAQQCPSGGWTLPDQALDTCTGMPATYEGPDTNSTSVAVEGLAAQGALTSTASADARSFLTDGQDADAGWSYYPSSAAAPQSTQPTSTALVIQALIALGTSPTASSLQRGTATPVSSVLSFQLTSGSDAGAFAEAPTTSSGNIVATYESIPALAGLTLPLPSPSGGYREVSSGGGVLSFGNAGFYGSEGGKTLNEPIVGMAATPTGKGYWEVASDGGIFTFGNAGFYGSEGGKTLNEPIVGMAATPTGKGYWEVASDGGIFTFGNAGFYGSEGGKVLNEPIVGMAATPTGKGYWEVASDGGIFTFGNAGFYGSEGGKVLNKPIVGMAATPTGKGYWEVASDGGIFTFGNAGFYGSEGGKTLNEPIVGMAATPTGKGYWEVASDGGIFTFGNAGFYGSEGGKVLNEPIVGIGANLAGPT